MTNGRTSQLSFRVRHWLRQSVSVTEWDTLTVTVIRLSHSFKIDTIRWFGFCFVTATVRELTNFHGSPRPTTENINTKYIDYRGRKEGKSDKMKMTMTITMGHYGMITHLLTPGPVQPWHRVTDSDAGSGLHLQLDSVKVSQLHSVTASDSCQWTLLKPRWKIIEEKCFIYTAEWLSWWDVLIDWYSKLAHHWIMHLAGMMSGCR